jgi:hypothetical protein
MNNMLKAWDGQNLVILHSNFHSVSTIEFQLRNKLYSKLSIKFYIDII